MNVSPRQAGQKSEIKTLRSQGKVLANVYGPGKKNEVCSLDEKELRKAFNNDLESNYVIELKSNENHLNGKKVILKAISRNPMWKIEHIDLYEIAMDRPFDARVPIHYTGTAEGVKNEGGILNIIRRFMKVRALPGDMPDTIEVDVSALKLNESLHISEIKVSSKIKVLDSAKFALVSVNEPEKEEVVAAPTAAEGAAAGEGAAAATATGATAPAAGAAAPAKDAGGDKGAKK